MIMTQQQMIDTISSHLDSVCSNHSVVYDIMRDACDIFLPDHLCGNILLRPEEEITRYGAPLVLAASIGQYDLHTGESIPALLARKLSGVTGNAFDLTYNPTVQTYNTRCDINAMTVAEPAKPRDPYENNPTYGSF